jgi:hypothetical protein
MNKNKCLQCEKHPISRGLCRTHYNQFDKAKKLAIEMNVDLDVFENELMRKGLLLPIKHGDAFEAVVQELAKKNSVSAEADAEAEKIRSRIANKTSSNPNPKNRKAE